MFDDDECAQARTENTDEKRRRFVALCEKESTKVEKDKIYNFDLLRTNTSNGNSLSDPMPWAPDYE